MPDPHDGPARRGRRIPELAEQLAQLPEEVPNDGADLKDEDVDLPEMSLVIDGDVITCKITHEVPIVPGYSSHFSYGQSTRVQPGEDDEEVFVRVANNCHEKVGRLIEAASEQYQAEVEARKNAPIQFNG